MHWDIIAAAFAPFLLLFTVIVWNVWIEAKKDRE